jgi:hypothetical protein
MKSKDIIKIAKMHGCDIECEGYQDAFYKMTFNNRILASVSNPHVYFYVWSYYDNDLINSASIRLIKADKIDITEAELNEWFNYNLKLLKAERSNNQIKEIQKDFT